MDSPIKKTAKNEVKESKTVEETLHYTAHTEDEQLLENKHNGKYTKNEKWLGLGVGFIAILIHNTVLNAILLFIVFGLRINLGGAPASVTIPISSSIFLLSSFIVAFLVTGKDRPKRNYWRKFVEITKLNKIKIRALFIALATAPFIYLASVLIASAISGMDPSTSGGGNETSGRIAALTGIGLIIVSLFVGVLTPIFEEIFFRGVMLGAMARFTQNIWYTTAIILFTSLTFGFMHMQGPLNTPANIMAVITPTLLGLVAAIYTTYFKSLYPAITLHIAYNSLVLAMILN